MGLLPKIDPNSLGGGFPGMKSGVQPGQSIFGEDVLSTLPTDYSKPLSRTNRLPGQAYYDESVNNELIPQQLSRDENAYRDLLTYGVDGSGVPGGQSSDPMAQALQNRMARDTNTAVSGTKTRAGMNAETMASDTRDIAQRELGAQYENEVRNFQQQYNYEIKRHDLLNKWKKAQADARANLFGQIFSGIGAAVGAGAGFLVGGPAGAVVGGSLGGKLGGAAGG